MHLQLTDLLTCPHCGPEAGLVLLADELRERRVVEGSLGCPICLGRWPIREGIAALDPAGAGPTARESAGAADRDAAVRMAALLGVTRGPAVVLVGGPDVRHAPALAELIEALEVVAVHATPPAQAAGVSRITAGALLPFVDGRLNGVWLSGEAAAEWLEEAARILMPGGRLVLDPAPETAHARLDDAGLRQLAEQASTILSVRSA